MASGIRLNLGCSDDHHSGYVNVDRVPPADRLYDLEHGWVALPGFAGGVYLVDKESSVSEIRAHDIFEHLPDKIHTMNEAWRVLEPGGKLDLFVPTTDGRGAFQDPTHRSFWTPNDLWYFCPEFAEWQRFHTSYGIIAQFGIVIQDHSLYGNKIDQVWKLRAVLEAIK